MCFFNVLCYVSRPLIHLFLQMLKYVLPYKYNCIMISNTFNFFTNYKSPHSLTDPVLCGAPFFQTTIYFAFPSNCVTRFHVAKIRLPLPRTRDSGINDRECFTFTIVTEYVTLCSHVVLTERCGFDVSEKDCTT